MSTKKVTLKAILQQINIKMNLIQLKKYFKADFYS